MNIQRLETRKNLRTTRSRWVDKDTRRITLVQGDVALWVDVDRLFDKLGGAALLNKNGKAILAGGAVQAICVGRESQDLNTTHDFDYETTRAWVNGGGG